MISSKKKDRGKGKGRQTFIWVTVEGSKHPFQIPSSRGPDSENKKKKKKEKRKKQQHERREGNGSESIGIY